ncbi:GGDEF domain-containing protein [Campylobacter sp. MG1]|uniref:GGDEF domain-containing protein n=1 Tax=Campylobacter sp. MG1 TaxID=2976332 RepID=UPI00226C8945|nr:GGDEF domain-containing protein [Campylobacter sp. MG1]
MFEFVFYTLFEKSYTTYFEFASLFLLIFFCIDGYKLIFYDSLTKLLNRRAFDKAIITKNDIICLIGVDCFKNINEKYGIDAGDFVLKKLASVLKDNYKQIYRFGGDEFIIIFNNIEFKDCILELDNIRKVISNYDFSFGKNKIKLTISAGLSQVFDDKFSALKKANEYLYTAKSNGRNRVIYGK